MNIATIHWPYSGTKVMITFLQILDHYKSTYKLFKIAQPNQLKIFTRSTEETWEEQ